jgi:hypothetical protein
LMLREFQCSWGISWFVNFFVLLQWGGARAGDFPLTFFYLLSVWNYLLSPKLLSTGGGGMGGGARGGGPAGESIRRWGGRARDFPVAEGHGYPHQCISRQWT